jgi:hypothetical protein
MSNFLNTVEPNGISGAFTALQKLQAETNKGVVIDLQLTQELSELSQATIAAQLNFTQSEATEQMHMGWSQMAGYIAQGATALGGIALGEIRSPSAPVEPEPMKVTIDEETSTSTAAAAEETVALEGRFGEDDQAVEMKNMKSSDSEDNRAPAKTDPKIQDKSAIVEGANQEGTASAANAKEVTETDDEKAAKAKADEKLEKANETWQNSRNATLMRYNTIGTAVGQFGQAVTTPITSFHQSWATEEQGYATLAGGALQNIQTAQGTLNSAMEQQRGQASTAVQAEISIIQTGHPIAG